MMMLTPFIQNPKALFISQHSIFTLSLFRFWNHADIKSKQQKIWKIFLNSNLDVMFDSFQIFMIFSNICIGSLNLWTQNGDLGSHNICLGILRQNITILNSIYIKMTSPTKLMQIWIMFQVSSMLQIVDLEWHCQCQWRWSNALL